MRQVQEVSDRDNFNIDIPIYERAKTIEDEIEEIRFHQQYVLPAQKMLDQHRREYIQYIRSLIKDGCTEIRIDGEIIYKKH
ncbi:MAG: hypothetical protein ACI4V7_03085 [Succinivibrionaceae bacterium]